ncbi:hypothetical protein F5888DRAFT_1878356, partial [Russula emetica]
GWALRHGLFRCSVPHRALLDSLCTRSRTAHLTMAALASTSPLPSLSRAQAQTPRAVVDAPPLLALILLVMGPSSLSSSLMCPPPRSPGQCTHLLILLVNAPTSSSSSSMHPPPHPHRCAHLLRTHCTTTEQRGQSNFLQTPTSSTSIPDELM